MAGYVPLWCRSHFSFLEGASHPEELVDTAARLGLERIALTDRDGVYGAVRAHVRAREVGVGLIVGSEVTVDDGSTVVLLAQDRAGYASLCGLVTKGRLRCEKGRSQVTWDEVCGHAPGLVALWGGRQSLLVTPDDAVVDPVSARLRDAFGDRLYALVARHRNADEAAPEARLRRRAHRLGLRTVAGHEVLYHTPARRRLQDVLTCIRLGIPLAEAGRQLRPNTHHTLLPEPGIAVRFADDPASLARTREVADRCTFSMAELHYRYPSELQPDGRTTAEHLRKLTYDGAQWRYDGAPSAEVLAQIARELDVIEQLDCCGYFLTMHDIVQFCARERILCQGRGSAANSVVCYCLGITAIDPSRMGLLFERFLSLERAEPPDIDLDIAHARREEVIQYVYERYDRDHAAMVANLIRYRTRSAIRDVGKVLGIPEVELDRVARLASWHGGNLTKVFEQAGLDPEAPLHRQLAEVVDELRDFPRHLSIHPGGFLLGSDPVHTLVPIENATMPGRTVVQWDKEDVESAGLFKVDLLGLGALTHLDLAFTMLRQHRGVDLTLATVPKEDKATYDMICKGDTVGVFQIESRAQMAMLPRLKPRNFYDLVIEVSIVRPGPISGGMVHPYLRRRAGEEDVTYPHDCLKPVLAKTLGVPIFQEQVMRLAMVAADYTAGESDQLRRDMAAWRQAGRIENHHEKIVSRMVAKGIDVAFAERVFAQIRGFGEYGFPESHAASFALIAYATAWLRCHHLDVFVATLLNAQPMGFYSPSTIVEDARRNGVVIRPPCVLRSSWDCTMEPVDEVTFGTLSADIRLRAPLAVRVGLRYVRGLDTAAGQRILAARALAPFTSPADCAHRAKLDTGDHGRLAESGAFDGFGATRREVLWSALLPTEAPSSFLDQAEPSASFVELDPVETLAWDHARTGMSTRGHALGPIRAKLDALKLPVAAQVSSMRDGARIRYAGLVICRQRPGTASGVTFMTLEDETGFVNLVVWTKVFEQYMVLAKTAAFLGVTGKVQAKDGVVHLIAEHLWEPQQDTPAAVASRDFH